MMPRTFVTIVALAVGLAACVTDVRTRRIPNVLTFGAAGAAVNCDSGSARADRLPVNLGFVLNMSLRLEIRRQRSRPGSNNAPGARCAVLACTVALHTRHYGR